MLTYTICEILERSTNDITYGELHALVGNRYTQMGRTGGPKPLIEGLSRDRQVLGTAIPGRSRFTLASDGGAWKVLAGRLHGLTAGSVLAVYPPRDQKNSDKLLGYVRIQNAYTLDATVAPVAYADSPAMPADSLMLGARCEPVYLDYGAMRLKIAVVLAAGAARAGSSATAESAARSRQIESELRDLAAKPDALFKLVPADEHPDWVVQDRDGAAMLLSADCLAIAGTLPARAPRFQLPEKEPGKALAQYVGRICRAQNLLRLTSPGIFIHHPARAANGLSMDASAIDVEVEMLKLQDENDVQGTPVNASGGELATAGWRMGRLARDEP